MNPYRQAREVENDALSRMTEPSPKEIGWDEGYAAGLHEAEAALEVAAQIMRDIPDAAITEGGWHNRAFGWLAAHDRRLAAATPDPPTDAHRPWPIAPDTVMPSRRQPVRWGSRADDPPTEIHDDPEKTKAYLAGLAAGRTEAAAASPDERLREVLREIVRQVEKYPALSPTGIMVRDDIAGMVEGTARAALAASPDERLREALERIIDIPLVMGGETNPTVSIADEMAHVAREALAAADRDKPGEPHEHEWRPTGYGGGSATSKRGVTTFRHEQCTVCGATSRMDLPPVSDETEES